MDIICYVTVYNNSDDFIKIYFNKKQNNNKFAFNSKFILLKSKLAQMQWHHFVTLKRQ